jgi:CMP-N,N'-diacetyllegionaminic acid synthase
VKILTIIPARMGSRRVPQKNLADVGGAPMFVWSIQAAQQAGLSSDDIIVSTDGDTIAEIARQNGCVVNMRRPALAGDDVPMMAVVRDLAAGHSRLSVFDAILLLQPTSPLRTWEDIAAAIDVMETNGAEAVISVTDAPSDLVFEVGHAGRLRNVRATDPLVVPNGAIFLIRMDIVFTHTWWDCLAYAYRMPKERSIDVDTQADLEMARDLMRKRLGDKNVG